MFGTCSDVLFYGFKATDKDAIIGLLTMRCKTQRHGISDSYQKQENKVSQCFHFKAYLHRGSSIYDLHEFYVVRSVILCF